MEYPFEINAGKYDDDGRNYKYCDFAKTLDEAIIKYQSVSDYPWSELIYHGNDNTTWVLQCEAINLPSSVPCPTVTP